MVINQKELNVLLFVVLVLSIVFFGYILFFVMDIVDIKPLLVTEKIMKDMKSGNYSEVYNGFNENYEKIQEEFIAEQDARNKILGNIEEYKYTRKTGGLFNVKDGKKIVAYKVKFSKAEDGPMELLWFLTRTKHGWKVVDYRLNKDHLDLTAEIQKDIKPLDRKGTDHNFKDLKTRTESIIDLLRYNKYEEIYELFSNEVKNKGGREQFVFYLKSAKDKYGSFDCLEYEKQSISKDGIEIKFDYKMFSKDIGKDVYISIWLKNNEEIRLSGFKVYEYYND